MNVKATRLYSEREVIERERKAFALGVNTRPVVSTEIGTLGVRREVQDQLARIAYPLPKVTRSRTYRDGDGYTWRAEDGKLRWSSGGTLWNAGDFRLVRPSDVKPLAALLANPTEEVDADECN